MQQATVKGPKERVRGIGSAQRVVFVRKPHVIPGPTPRAQPFAMPASCHGPESLPNLQPSPLMQRAVTRFD